MMKKTWLALACAWFLAGCASMGPATVADTAAKRPELSTLSKLIADAGLTDTLKANGPYTVFAPSDEAFKAVPARTMAELAANKELLKQVLSYHVVPSKLSAAEVTNASVKTVQGGSLALSKAGTFVTVEDAMVVQADVTASNGVVHVIDRVLMPPKK